MVMKRRTLIRGVASSSLLAFGAAGAAGEAVDASDFDETHMKIRQDDGSYEVMPMEEYLEGPYDVRPELCCSCVCCSNCPCDCSRCYGC